MEKKQYFDELNFSKEESSFSKDNSSENSVIIKDTEIIEFSDSVSCAPDIFLYHLAGYIFFVVCMIPITLFFSFIGEVKTGSTLFVSLYERPNYYTSYFSLGKLCFWWILCIIGYVFVTTINLRNKERENPLKSKDGSYKDILILILIAPVLYFTAPIIFLRDKYDMQRGCISDILEGYGRLYFNSDDATILQNYTSISSLIQNSTIEDERINIFIPAIFELDFSQVKFNFSCDPYTVWEVFWYNYVFVIVFFIGLNWTHLRKIPVKNLSLKAEDLKKWGTKQIIVIGIALTVAVANLIIVSSLYSKGGVLFLYLSVSILFIFILTIVTLILHKTHSFHLHHYVWSGMFMILCGYQHIYITILAGISSGIMVEGISRWGFDKWWSLKPNTDEQSNEIQQKKPLLQKTRLNH